MQSISVPGVAIHGCHSKRGREIGFWWGGVEGYVECFVLVLPGNKKEDSETLFASNTKLPLGSTLNMYWYWFWLCVGIGIGVGISIVVGVGICIGICVGIGIRISVGIGNISQNLAASRIIRWHSGASGSIWQHLGASGNIWQHLGLQHLAASGIIFGIWDDLAASTSTSIREHLAATGSIWASGNI